MRTKFLSGQNFWEPNLCTVKHMVIGWWPSKEWLPSYHNILVDLIFIMSTFNIPNLSLLPCLQVASNFLDTTNTRTKRLKGNKRTHKAKCWWCSAPQKFLWGGKRPEWVSEYRTYYVTSIANIMLHNVANIISNNTTNIV